MKKLIAILTIAIVLVGAVFATTNDKITLTTTVGRIKPGFTIFSGSTAAGGTIAVNEDLSEADIVATFGLKQSGNESGKAYSRYKGNITLTVTIDKFSTTIGSGDAAHTANQSTAYEIQPTETNDQNEVTGGTRKGTGISGKLTLSDPVIANDKHSVDFALAYSGKKVENTDATDLGTIVVKWTKDPDLEMEGESATYSTDVKLTYTVN